MLVETNHHNVAESGPAKKANLIKCIHTVAKW